MKLVEPLAPMARPIRSGNDKDAIGRSRRREEAERSVGRPGLPRHLGSYALFVVSTAWLSLVFLSGIQAAPVDLAVLAEIDLGQPIGQLRAVPVDLGPGKPKAVAALYAADAEIDPFIGMFYESRFYRANQKLSGVGYNLFNLGGI